MEQNTGGSNASPTASVSPIGRFAPSPTGPLHTGSLLAALASFLEAKAGGGRWLVRMEDLDPPRETPEAARDILLALEKLGLHWDGPVAYQSRRHRAYAEALDKLARLERIYPCDCTRQALLEAGGIHGNRCRSRNRLPGQPRALRFQVGEGVLRFDDKLQGPQCFDLARDIGDFVVKRKDGYYAYQLAVVVDDAWQGVTEVVRGVDLLDSTPRQIRLQRVLGLPTPAYAHVPVIVNALGQKLSKQHFARPLELDRPSTLLVKALGWLGQQPEPGLAAARPEEVLRWAVRHWNPAPLRGVRRLPEPAQQD